MATPTNLPAAATVGQLYTSANVNDLRGAFRILQVVNVSYATETNNTTNVYADTGLSATITPQETSSKILIFTSQLCYKSAGNAGNAVYLQLLRGATSIIDYPLNLYNNVAQEAYGTVTMHYVDSPNTTSATTFKMQFRNFLNAS
jgi:hypothetical protein